MVDNWGCGGGMLMSNFFGWGATEGGGMLMSNFEGWVEFSHLAVCLAVCLAFSRLFSRLFWLRLAKYGQI